MVKMQYFFLALFFLSVGILKSQKEKITIIITFKSPYCGGARPTPEMVAEAEKKKAYASKTIIIVNEKQKVDSAKTNSKGQLTIKLKKGTYNLYEAWKYYKSGPGDMPASKFDKTCLKAEWEKPIYTITKTNKKTNIEEKSEIIIQCPWALPCLSPENVPNVPE